MTPDSLRQQLLTEISLSEQSLWLECCDCTLHIRSNSDALLRQLRHYYAHVLGPPAGSDCIDLVAIEAPAAELDIDFTDWSREPGKTGRKDSYHDLPGARLVRKVRTGMLFLQAQDNPLAFGPCVANDNQVINFINSQLMNRLQQRGALIAHAAAVCNADQGLAIAGLSGGGKSTLMLQLMEQPELDFVSNDRLFIEAADHGLTLTGIPKQPRINPGTLLHNTRLSGLLPEPRQQELRRLPNAELWDLEDKYDVMIREHYGSGRMRESCDLGAILILNWSRDSGQALAVEEVDFDRRPDLLPALMKSPGPFYQDREGHFLADGQPLESARYSNLLRGIPVWEASGRVDFEALSQFCITKVLRSRP